MTFQWYRTKNKLPIPLARSGTYKSFLAVTAASTYTTPVANDLAEESPARILSQALGANPTTATNH